MEIMLKTKVIFFKGKVEEEKQLKNDKIKKRSTTVPHQGIRSEQGIESLD